MYLNKEPFNRLIVPQTICNYAFYLVYRRGNAGICIPHCSAGTRASNCDEVGIPSRTNNVLTLPVKYARYVVKLYRV